MGYTVSANAPVSAFVAELEARLKRLDERAHDLEASLALVGEERQLINRLLEIEKARHAERGHSMHIVPKGFMMRPAVLEPEPIGNIVRDALLDGPKTKPSLNDMAEQGGHRSPGRGIHAILMNYGRLGYAIESKGLYSLTDKGRAALSRKAEGAQNEMEA